MNYWTNGLKDWFGLREIDDADLAIDEPEKAEEEFVIRLNVEQWRDVLATNTRGELLSVAAAQGESGVLNFLEEIKTRPKKYRGWFNDNARPDIRRFFH